jgi:hypothetical protein
MENLGGAMTEYCRRYLGGRRVTYKGWLGDQASMSSVSGIKAKTMSEPTIQVPSRIEKCHKDWKRGAIQLEWIALVLGILSVTSSIAVTVLAGDAKHLPYIKILAAISAASVGLLSFFQVHEKIRDYWAGWKSLNGPIVLYQAGMLDLRELVTSYEKAEILVGTMEFRVAPIQTSEHSKGV